MTTSPSEQDPGALPVPRRAAGRPEPEEESLEHTRMTLGEHLDELRTRLIRSVVALVVAFSATWLDYQLIAEWMLWPYRDARANLELFLVDHYRDALAQDPSLDWRDYFETAEPRGPADLLDIRRIPETPRGDGAAVGFMFYLRFCFYFSLFLAGPFALYQMWRFVAAGLYRRERRVVHHYFPLSLGLFLAGVLFGFFVIVPQGLYFLAKISVGQIMYWESIDTYRTFLTSMTLAVGIVFQLPVLMLVLTRIGIVPAQLYSRYRPHMIVGALVLAAVITPPDVITQLLMAGPIVVLYEVGHGLARLAERRSAAAARAA